MKKDREYMIYEDQDKLRESRSPNAENHHFHRIIPVDFKVNLRTFIELIYQSFILFTNICHILLSNSAFTTDTLLSQASGILEANKQWGDGLQQFIEMKHQLSLSELTTVTNFMSNFHFFKRYAQALGVFGVTGTIGDEAGRTFMQKHFKVLYNI